MADYEDSWEQLTERFAQIIEQAEGPSKSKSGVINVYWNCFEKEIHVDLGTYDIGDWSSWTHLGPFKSEKAARSAVHNKLKEAAKVVVEEAADD